MIRDHELVAMIDRLQTDALDSWIARGWIVPVPGETGHAFDEADVARIGLICDLLYDLEFGEENVPVVLSLVDQLHDARRVLRALGTAIDAEPDDIRQRLAARIKQTMGGDA